MPAFDPDKYLAEKTGAQAAPFDPDKYLAEKVGAKDPGDEGIVNKAFNAVEDTGSYLAKKAAPALDFVNKNVVEPIDRISTRPARMFIKDVAAGDKVGDAYKKALSSYVEDVPEISGPEAMKKNAERTGNDWENTTLSQKFPEAFSETGRGVKLQKGGLLDLSAAKLGGYGLDALNPTTALALAGAPAELKAETTAGESGGTIAKEAQSAAKQTPKTELGLMQDAVKASKNKGLTTELPNYSTIEKIEQSVPDLEHKILPQQKEAYTNKTAYDSYSAQREAPTKAASTLRDYESLQRNEGIKKIQDTIDSLSDDVQKSKVDRGENIVGKVADVYERNKARTAPLFNEIDSIQVPQKYNGDFIRKSMANDLGLKDYFYESDTGPKLLPYDRRMGISKKAYDIVNSTMDTLNNNQLSMKELRSIRESLRADKALGATADNAVIERARSSILGHMEDVAQQARPDLNIRDTFRDYAKNEAMVDQLEKVMGGKLDEPFNIMKETKPEKVTKKLFSSTNSVKLAKEYLGDDFNSVRANYLQELVDESSPNGVFSAQKFKTNLSKNMPQLKEAFADAPQAINRVDALSDFIRLIPEAPSANPSGTAKTIGQMIKEDPIGAAFRPKETLFKGLMGGAKNYLAEKKSEKAINGLLKK